MIIESLNLGDTAFVNLNYRDEVLFLQLNGSQIWKNKLGDFVFSGLNSSGNITTDETAIVAYMIGDGTTTAGNGYKGTDTEIIIPATYNNLPVTTIGARAFQKLAGLTSIQIPASVTTIGAYAFHSVTAIITFEEGSGISGLGNYAFFGCSGLTSINLVEGLTEIPQTVFYNCDLLTSITIPSTVTVIKPNAFEHCNNLSSVEILEGVTTIGNKAFYTCYGLTSITIPSTVTSIGANAFASCRLLTEMTLLPKTPPTLAATNAISSATKTIYVPSESLEAYQTATNWSNFANIMVGKSSASWKTVWTGSLAFSSAENSYTEITLPVEGVVANLPTRVSGQSGRTQVSFSNVELNYDDVNGTKVVSELIYAMYLKAPVVSGELTARVRGMSGQQMGFSLFEVQQYY